MVPPKEWKARKQGYADVEIVVSNPIEQNVSGSGGFYELFYLVR